MKPKNLKHVQGESVQSDNGKGFIAVLKPVITLQLIADEPKLQISAMISVQNFATQKYRYCKHLCRIDQPSKLVISDYDISIITRVGISN